MMKTDKLFSIVMTIVLLSGLFSTAVNAAERWTYSCPASDGSFLTRNGNKIEGRGLLLNKDESVVDFDILYEATIQSNEKIPTNNLINLYYRNGVDLDNTERKISCHYATRSDDFSPFTIKSRILLPSGIEWKVINKTRTAITVER